LKIEAIRLLGSPYFSRRAALLAFVADGAAQGDFMTRLAIDALRQVGTKQDLVALVRQFAQLRPWSRRSVIAWASAAGFPIASLVAEMAFTDVTAMAMTAKGKPLIA
jgi:hypothetical protein